MSESEVSYAEFMWTLKEMQNECNSAEKCSQFNNCKRITIKFPETYEWDCVRVDHSIISNHGLSDFEAKLNTPRIIYPDQDSKVDANPIRSIYVS